MPKKKSKVKKKKRKLLEKAKVNGTANKKVVAELDHSITPDFPRDSDQFNKKVLGKTLKSLIIDEEHQHGLHFDK
ncbi:hypothetical protein [Enterococcus casseliflavus]|uniref:hypothetical protein n=1 Tax=Enterococcus casseliflavus TaxID=37734 RepID=UPI003D0FB343